MERVFLQNEFCHVKHFATMCIRYHQFNFFALLLLVGLYGEVAGAPSSLPVDSHAGHKKFRILSIDGGGLRGIIPARILQEIEEQTGKRIFELFDLVIGTSTGGLLSLALVTPDGQGGAKYKASDLVDFYKQQGPKIFARSWIRKLNTGWGLWAPKYSRKNLDAALADILGNIKLSQTLKPALIISYSLDRSLPHVWTTQKALLGVHIDYYLRDVAGATSAAPTYFAPKRLIQQDGKILHEIDGGIWANNPEFTAIIALNSLKPAPHNQDIVVVSIGTGAFRSDTKICATETHKLRNAGVLGWLLGAQPNLIEMMMGADSEWSESAMSMLYQHSYRLQVSIPEAFSSMDDSRNLGKLESLAVDYINNSSSFKHLCTDLVQWAYQETQ